MSASVTVGTIHVFTYKDGPLARFAHDLRLTLQRFSVAIDGRNVNATFDPKSLVVDGVVKGPRIDTRVLTEKDLREIRENIEHEVLKCRTFPEIAYSGRLVVNPGGRLSLKGTLSLLGRQGPLGVSLSRSGETVKGEASVMQTRWGIQPFSALLGAIKIKNVVDVRFELPVPPSEGEP
ncbi:MAG: YceI family protein [Polyangiaceae bacterium]|nr:YceI family protein [Polyangiaceae bacterium]